ncbi:MAG TPA: hypothetical protein VJN18_32745 [Polyangiaceae bacterium]|nr:hypothetical protein [Polyangiaceae bacterium]
MAFSTTFRSSIAGLIFTATAIADIADNDATSPITNIQISLHESDPTSGNQTTGEGNYTSYARVAVARTTSGYTDTAGVVTNDAAITFPACTGGSDTISHVGNGTASSGSGVLIVAGALTASLSVSNGITPQFSISSLTVTIA